MCRFLCWAGESLRLDQLLLDPEHSLVVQSYKPKEMADAILNADGFGVAWYTPEDPTPACYRSVLPMWGDENFPAMARHLRSTHVVANVRSATPGVGFGLANTQPFVKGRLAFTHNGYLERFREGLVRPLRRSLGDDAYDAIAGTSDSEHLFALILDERTRLGPDASLTDAVVGGLLRARTLLREAGRRGLLNVALSDGEALVAARYAVDAAAPTLYVHEGALDERGLLVASEAPYEDPRWQSLESGEVLTRTPAGVVTRTTVPA